MNREQKKEVIKTYGDLFSDYGSGGAIILAEYAGIDVESFKTLRKKLTMDGGCVVVVKNRLAKIALAETDCEFLHDHFSGPISMAYSKDPVSLAKALSDFAKDNTALKIRAGVMDGASLDAQKIKTLSELPSLDELRAKLLSLLMAAPRNIASILDQMPSRIARVLQAKNDKNE